ncbi:MAG TPA: glycogen/starch synthase [Sphingobacterium sp.]|nr:glycogen/starch synthase [Sphingobacterium sp.]
MAKTKILFITHEMSPFLEISKISEITRNLPQAVQEKGFEIRILMPRFGVINERRNRLHEVIRLSGMNIVVDNNDNPLIIKVASLPAARMQVYFLDNEDFFPRKKVFKETGNKYFDNNNERSLFFCKGAMETVKKLGWAPDIVHCHGWFSAMVPAYLKKAYHEDPIFKDTKVIYSLYNEDYDGVLGEKYAQMASQSDLSAEDVAAYGEGTYSDLYKGALSHSDLVIFAEEEESLNPDVVSFVKSEGIDFIQNDDDPEFERYIKIYEDCEVVEEA